MFDLRIGDSGKGVPVVGQQAPDFSLPSQDGGETNLKQFRGKWVVLYFYPKDNTAGCTVEAHNFQRDLSEYEGENAVVIGISVDSSNSHREFCTKQGLTYKLLADTEKKVTRAFGSLRSIVGFTMAARNTFLIDPAGKIAKVWTGVNPSGHSEQVLTALQALRK